MINKTISIISILVFLGLSIAPLFANQGECDIVCCASLREPKCTSIIDDCPGAFAEGRSILIFPLVSAPVLKYHLMNDVVNPVLFHADSFFSALNTESPPVPEASLSPPAIYPIPLRI